MNRLPYVLQLLLAAVLFSSQSAVAEQANEENPHLYVRDATEFLRSDPGGTPTVEVNRAARLKKLEERGEWLRVSVEGWIKKKLLDSKQRSQPEEVDLRGLRSLKVTKYEVEERKDPVQAVLKLTYRNTTEKNISAWGGIMIVRDHTGKVLFRTAASDEGLNLAPDKTAKISYYWTPGEQAYDRLLIYYKKGLQVEFAKVKVFEGK